MWPSANLNLFKSRPRPLLSSPLLSSPLLSSPLLSSPLLSPLSSLLSPLLSSPLLSSPLLSSPLLSSPLLSSPLLSLLHLYILSFLSFWSKQTWYFCMYTVGLICLNVSKTKIMAIGPGCVEEPLIIDGNEVESVSKFNFLGSLITKDGGCSQEIGHRLAMARSAMTNMSKIWAGRGITRTTKVRLVQALTIALYASETWTLNKADRNRIAAFEMWCWRRMLRIPWTMRRTNASIPKKIGV